MARPLPETISQVRDLSTRLNALVDEANEAVRSAEQFLEECRVGVATRIIIKQAQPSDDISNAFARAAVKAAISSPPVKKEVNPPGTYLYYCRIGGKFRIGVGEITETGSIEEPKAWAQCSRNEKLEAFAKLPNLFEKIVQQLEADLKRTEAAAASFKQLQIALRGE